MYGRIVFITDRKNFVAYIQRKIINIVHLQAKECGDMKI